MFVVIVKDGTEKCRFIPRSLDAEEGVLITPPRHRPWPIGIGAEIQDEDGTVIGVVTAQRRAQFQRCRLDFVPSHLTKVEGSRAETILEELETRLEDNPGMMALSPKLAHILRENGLTTDFDVEAKLLDGDEAFLALRGIGKMALAEIKLVFGL